MKKRVRAKFLPHEDSQLRALVAEFGEDQWRKVASRMPNRNVRQCRERWKHYICSNMAKEPWKPEEDEILFRMVNEMGFKWTKISKFLPGRTDIQVKSRWFKNFHHMRFENKCCKNDDNNNYHNQNDSIKIEIPDSIDSEILTFCEQLDFQYGEIRNSNDRNEIKDTNSFF